MENKQPPILFLLAFITLAAIWLILMVAVFYRTFPANAMQPVMSDVPEIVPHDSKLYIHDPDEFCDLWVIECVASKEEVKTEIIRQAILHGVNVETSLRIAECESGYSYDATRKGGTDTGVYQWLESTWDHIGARGTRLNYKHNIREFMRWYPLRPEWWVCR